MTSTSAVLPAFRHDPVKSVLSVAGGGSFHWTREPAVCGYRMLTYDNVRLGRKIPVPISATPAVISGVGVLVGSDDGYVRLYDRTLAKVYWERRLDSGIYASLVVDAARRHVVVAATSGLVVCFDLRGWLVWSVRPGYPVFATPTVLPDADMLVIAAFHSRCVGLRLATGSVVFDRALPKPWHADHGGSAAFRDPYASPVTTADGNVIVCCAEHVLCIRADGAELWRHTVGHSIKASPVAVHETGEIAVFPVDGRCLFLDGTTGRPLDEVFLGAKVTGSAAVSRNVLAVGTQLDTVTGLDVRTHQIVWRAPQGAPRSYTSFSVLPEGDFIATSQRGNAVCLQRDSGRFRWETSQVLGLPDHEPAMDITPIAGPDGSLYCASYSGVIYRFAFQPVATEGISCR